MQPNRDFLAKSKLQYGPYRSRSFLPQSLRTCSEFVMMWLHRRLHNLSDNRRIPLRRRTSVQVKQMHFLAFLAVKDSHKPACSHPLCAWPLSLLRISFRVLIHTIIPHLYSSWTSLHFNPAVVRIASKNIFADLRAYKTVRGIACILLQASMPL